MARPALLLLAAVALGGCGSDDASRSTSDDSPAEQPPAVGQARELCAAIAREYHGQVAAAYDTTVQAVREHMADPHDADGDPSVAPLPGDYVFPDGWAAKAPDDTAAACYVDALIPVPLPLGAPAADRGMFMAAEGAASFLVKAGPRATMQLAPLPTPEGQNSGD